MKYNIVTALVLFASPFFVYAAPRNLSEAVRWVADFVGLVIPVLIAIIFLYILWGFTRHWIMGGGSEEGAKQGKWVLVTGLIGLTVIIGMWGLVSLVRNAIFY